MCIANLLQNLGDCVFYLGFVKVEFCGQKFKSWIGFVEGMDACKAHWGVVVGIIFCEAI